MISTNRMMVFVAVALLVAMAAGQVYAGTAATVVVAPSNAPDDVKAKADIVCDATNDEVELLQSITRAKKHPTRLDWSPNAWRTVVCHARHSVLWLPGDYYLDSTLTIPDAGDMVIKAEGAYFHYRPTTGDAVVMQGMMRCRYYFGTIDTNSAGSALCARPTASMPQEMSIVKFTGLVGHNQKGIGLHLDNSVPGGGICTNRWEGTDISGFDIGVNVSDAAAKCDTNWFWFSYIRMCNTCIWEHGLKTDSAIWNVNVDASLPGSTAIRTGAVYGVWTVIMGTFAGKDQTKGIVLDPGASYNRFEVPVRSDTWILENNSGNTTNKFVLN